MGKQTDCSARSHFLLNNNNTVFSRFGGFGGCSSAVRSINSILPPREGGKKPNNKNYYTERKRTTIDTAFRSLRVMNSNY